MSKYDDDDFDDDEPLKSPVVRHVVRDLKTALKMKRVSAKAKLNEAKQAERRRRMELRAEIKKMKLMHSYQMSAVEKARAHVAQAGPFYLLLIVSGFVIALTTNAIPDKAVSTCATVITLVITGLMANLRSIITGNGHAEENDQEKK
tara:strand:- start:1960 stop:2400 length:441 start_codon:yes stop_codon:yes gene_type:complete